MKMKYGWLLIAAASALIGVGVTKEVQALVAHQRLVCQQWISTPPVYACNDGHSYVEQGGKLIDLGGPTPVPVLPQR